MASPESMLRFIVPVLRKKAETKREKKAAFTVARVKFLLNFH